MNKSREVDCFEYITHNEICKYLGTIGKKFNDR